MTILISPSTNQTVTSASSSVSSAPTVVYDTVSSTLPSAVLATVSSIILPTASATSTGKSLVRLTVATNIYLKFSLASYIASDTGYHNTVMC